MSGMNRSRQHRWAIFGVVLLAGCSGAQRPELAGVQDGQELPILGQRVGTYSRITQPLRLAIYDPGAMAVIPIDPGPVDFDQQMVLLAALGPTPTAEDQIRIRRVWRDGSVLRAEVVIERPGQTVELSPTAASPYHLVVVPHCSLNVAGFTAAVPKQMTEPSQPSSGG